MLDILRGPAKVCAKSGQELKPGEPIVSALVDAGGKWDRIDFARNAWAGPPTNAIAWWNGRIPVSLKSKTPTFRDEVLFECLDRLADDRTPGRMPYRYVVAILLLRRKKLIFEETRKLPNGSALLILRDTRTGNLLEIPDPQMTEEQVSSVQEEVIATLSE